MTYDPQNLESVLVYIRQRFGMGIFRESNKIYAIICDLSPKLKPYADVIRRLSERGTLAELEAVRNDLTQRDRVVIKTRNTLENELLMSADRAEYLISVLSALYGIAVKPIPTPTSGKIIKRGDCGANVHYTLDENGVLTISGMGAMRDFVWNKNTHTVDTPWWGETIFHAEIQNGVTTIGDFTFEGAELTSVTIPDSMREVRICAFASCEALTSVSIPDSVKNIEEGAFSYCTSLTSVTIPHGLTIIRDGIFQDCAGLKSLTIPDSVTTIGEGSFSGCLGLKSLNIPDSVTTIGNEAFAECVGLKSLTIPDSVTTIGENAFAGCEGLESVSVPARVKIGADAFPTGVRVTRRSATPGKIIKRGDCGANVRYTLDDNGVLTISGNGSIKDFVWNRALDTMETPWRDEREAVVYAKVERGVTRIGEGAFVDCTSMARVDLPDSLTTIGPCAFAECTALTSVTIPNGVKNIEESAFCYCEGLTSVNFPDSLTRIGETAFEDCTSLKSVNIPDSVTTIGKEAFKGCERLISVSVPARVTIEADAFPDSVRVTRRNPKKKGFWGIFSS